MRCLLRGGRRDPTHRTGRSFRRDGHADRASSGGTVRALAPAATYDLSKEDLAPVLKARPEVSDELCRALARRKAAGKLLASTELDNSVPLSRVAAWFFDRLHHLFDLATAD
jgi:hypothetical protein